MLSQLKSIGAGGILICALSVLGADTTDLSVQTPESELVTPNESGLPQDQALLQQSAPEEQQPESAEQQWGFPAPPPWVQKEMTFRIPILVPEGFPVPQPPNFPLPPTMPNPFPKWQPIPAQPDPGSMRIEKEIETDRFGNQWVVSKRSWTSKGMVCSDISRAPYSATQDTENVAPPVAPAPPTPPAPSDEPGTKLRPESGNPQAHVPPAAPTQPKQIQSSKMVGVGVSVDSTGRSQIYYQHSQDQPVPAPSTNPQIQ